MAMTYLRIIYRQLQVMAVVFGWRIVCVALMKAGITGWPLHHMRLTVHHVAHCFWTVGSRRTCVGSENYLRVDATVLSRTLKMLYRWRDMKRNRKIPQKWPGSTFSCWNEYSIFNFSSLIRCGSCVLCNTCRFRNNLKLNT